jgi:hypothetical protein
MLIIRRYKKNKSGRIFWEYKILYRDLFTNRTKTRKRRGFHSKAECQNAAEEMLGYLNFK